MSEGCLVILQYQYWQHVNADKELARIFPPTNKKRMEINSTINSIAEEIERRRKIMKEIAVEQLPESKK